MTTAELLGARVRKCRRLLGMTQQELADRAYCTKSFISQIEKGQTLPSIETLLLIAKELRQRPGYFLEPEAEIDVEGIVEAVREREYWLAEKRIKVQLQQLKERLS